MNRHIVVTLLIVAMAAVSCSGKEEAGMSTAGSPQETTTPEGATLVQKRCTICHTIERIVQADLDRSGWESTVDVMIDKGATLNDAERTAIIDYLAGK